MIHAVLSAVTLDNGLVIGILGLVAGMIPGVLAYLSEREKLKHAREQAISEREKLKEAREQAGALERSVTRLEDLVTRLQNALISIKDRYSTIEIPEIDGRTTPDPPDTGPPVKPPALVEQPPTPAGASGKYVIWMSPTDSTSPRYVLLTWETSAGKTGFRVRDYIDAQMLYPRGTASPSDPNFRSIETSLTLDEIWGRARCGVKARHDLDHRVDDLTWWRERLAILTAGHETGHRLAPFVPGGAGSRGVLLMLSSSQKPPPRTEVQWHAANCAKGGTTYLATTRILTGMVKDKSIVAFYGDVDLFNQVLGYGIFLDFIRVSTPEGEKILAENPHYNQYGMPDQVLGLIQMRDFKELPEGTCLELFNARIASSGASNGRPLTLANIPEGAARAQVYFQTLVQTTSA